MAEQGSTTKRATVLQLTRPYSDNRHAEGTGATKRGVVHNRAMVLTGAAMILVGLVLFVLGAARDSLMLGWLLCMVLAIPGFYVLMASVKSPSPG